MGILLYFQEIQLNKWVKNVYKKERVTKTSQPINELGTFTLKLVLP